MFQKVTLFLLCSECFFRLFQRQTDSLGCILQRVPRKVQGESGLQGLFHLFQLAAQRALAQFYGVPFFLQLGLLLRQFFQCLLLACDLLFQRVPAGDQLFQFGLFPFQTFPFEGGFLAGGLNLLCRLFQGRGRDQGLHLG